MVKTCLVDGCGKGVLARGWCSAHYNRWIRTGTTDPLPRRFVQPPAPVARPIEERFWEKVQRGDGCWLWVGGKTKLGYGAIWDNALKRHVMAHRLSWEIAHGRPIPDGLVVDHLCRNPPCVNPDHLEVVTISTNTARGLAPIAGSQRQRLTTHCPQGHAYDEQNTYVYKSSGGGQRRVCRACAIFRTQERRRREKSGG